MAARKQGFGESEDARPDPKMVEWGLMPLRSGIELRDRYGD
jgi:hypothetical protein